MLAPKCLLQSRYRILYRVGGGGFGNVYKAVDEVFGCTVAVKETKEQVSSHDQLRKAFEREARLLRNLKHECLPRVTDYFSLDHAQYLVMDYISGEDLWARLKKRIGREGPFTSAELLPWADKILSALEYLHTRPEPIIHRDIKPSNITLTEAGEVYLLDFGLAKGLTGQMSTMLDGQSLLSLAAFTHEYAPLEQLQSTGTEPQSDVYAFGATLYHLLTGHTPISASKRDETIHREHRDPLPPAHEVNPAIPQAVSEIISQAMTIRWWDRLATAKEMRNLLIEAAGKLAISQPEQHVTVRDAVLLEPRSQSSDAPLERRPSARGVQTVPMQTVARPLRTSRGWIVAGASVLLVTALALGARFGFPHWFTKSDIQKPDTEGSLSTVPAKPAVPMTPRNLKPTLLQPAHGGPIRSVAYSQDGKYVASASDDKKILLWNANNLDEPGKELAGHTGTVYSIAFSPDSKTLASAGKDGSIKLWNTTTLDPITLPIDQKRWPFLRVAFSPDGEYLASCAGKDATQGCEEIQIWEVRHEWKFRPLIGILARVHAIGFSPDSRTLVTVGLDRQMRFWDSRTGKERDQRTLDQELTSLSFFPGNGYLACGASDGTIRLWRYDLPDQDSAKLLRSVTTKSKDLNVVVAASPDNKTLASAVPFQEIRLWDITSGLFTNLLGQKAGTSQTSLSFSSDGQKLVSGDYFGFVRVWQ